MIEIEDLSKSYGEKTVFSGLSLTLPEAGILALTGSNGSGKTTLLRLLSGLEQPDGGRILLPENCRISYVFQDCRLLPALSVRQNILLVLEKSRRAEADRWLDRVGLSDFADALPDTLSGGMQQRAAIARALAYGGDLLLLDEPFFALDAAWKEKMMDEVKRAAENSCVLLTTHNLQELAYLGCKEFSLSEKG